MKTILNQKDRAVVQKMAGAMMEMNKRDDENAAQTSTYGFLWEAIRAFVKNRTGIDLRESGDWNMGGNETFADDIQAAINELAGRRKDSDVVAAQKGAGEYRKLREDGRKARIASGYFPQEGSLP